MSWSRSAVDVAVSKKSVKYRIILLMVQQSLHIQFLLKILRSPLNTYYIIYIYFYYILHIRYKIYYIHIYIFKVNTELNLLLICLKQFLIIALTVLSKNPIAAHVYGLFNINISLGYKAVQMWKQPPYWSFAPGKVLCSSVWWNLGPSALLSFPI